MVQPAKLEELTSQGIHEADLRGALTNDTIKSGKEDNKNAKDKNTDIKPDTTSDDDSSAKKDKDKSGDKSGKKEDPFDYQLARALDLIRGVHLFEKKTPSIAVEDNKK